MKPILASTRNRTTDPDPVLFALHCRRCKQRYFCTALDPDTDDPACHCGYLLTVARLYRLDRDSLARPTPKTVLYGVGSEAENRRQQYLDRAITNAQHLIRRAGPGSRHHARLKAGILIGGYVAGGFLDESAAVAALEDAILENTTTPKQALADVQRGIAYGMTKPITIGELETNRQRWMEQQGKAVRRA